MQYSVYHNNLLTQCIICEACVFEMLFKKCKSNKKIVKQYIIMSTEILPQHRKHFSFLHTTVKTYFIQINSGQFLLFISSTFGNTIYRPRVC